MQISQLQWTVAGGWSAAPAPADLVVAFGPSDAHAVDASAALAAAYPGACRVYCSAAGAIAGPTLVDDAVVVTAVRFAGTRVAAVAVEHQVGECSADVGQAGILLAKVFQRQMGPNREAGLRTLLHPPPRQFWLLPG